VTLSSSLHCCHRRGKPVFEARAERKEGNEAGAGWRRAPQGWFGTPGMWGRSTSRGTAELVESNARAALARSAIARDSHKCCTGKCDESHKRRLSFAQWRRGQGALCCVIPHPGAR
jgi:hypothetical protein